MSLSASRSDDETELTAILNGERSRRWRLVWGLVYGISLIILIWHIYYAYRLPLDQAQQGVIHLGMLLSIYYLSTLNIDPEGWKEYLDTGISITFLVASLAVNTYITLNFNRWLTEARQFLEYTNVDLLVGLVSIVIVTHATWRAYGKLLGGVVVGSIVYGLFGPMFPGILSHSGFTAERLIYINSVALSGTYGFILQVMATWVAIFILLAGIIEGYGGIRWVLDKAQTFSKKAETGVVQTAVVSSMVMGSIMGSSAANVATTGSFTIPLMKHHDVPGRDAAAIESVASTGGQILPPVMGSAAFIMANILGISYFTVIRGATLPALLYYLTTAIVVFLSAKRFGWLTKESELESESDDIGTSAVDRVKHAGYVFVDGSPLILPILALVYLLMVLRYSPLIAGMYSLLVAGATAGVRGIVTGESVRSALREWVLGTIEGAKIGAVNLAPLTAVGAALGIVVRIITATGFTQEFSLQMVGLAGGVFVLVLVFAALTSILFGMGMPTPAAYVVVAILTAPGLTQLGIQALNAHLFVFYFALLSTITPPIALSCAVGAGIAQASFWDTCKSTIKLGLFAFVLPFVFVLNPKLIYWDGMATFVMFCILLIGMLSVSIALVGYNTQSVIPHWQRGIYAATAIGLFFIPSVQIRLAIAAIVLLRLISITGYIGDIRSRIMKT